MGLKSPPEGFSKSALREAAEGFDPSFYRSTYPDVKGSNDELLAHYLQFGWREGRDPSPVFSTRHYLQNYPDVAESGYNPLLHYVRHGREEGRVADKARILPEVEQPVPAPEPAPAPEKDYRNPFLEPDFLRRRYHVSGKDGELAKAYVNDGWQDLRDPNPFTHVRFMETLYGAAGDDWTWDRFVELLREPRYLNPFLTRPTTLAELRVLLREDGAELKDLFVFDIRAYAAKQPDVLAFSDLHPVEHLFTYGLTENRLRNHGHLHPWLVRLDQELNDYENAQRQAEPFAVTSFERLLLQPVKQVPLDDARLAIGVVLYENSEREIGRLLTSIRANLADADFRCTIHLLDNSEPSLDLGWASEAFGGLDLKIETAPANPGFALGHNRLMGQSFRDGATHYLGLNPDGYLLWGALREALSFHAGLGGPALVELKTEPLCHPKWYHPATGETDWVSGAAFLLDRAVFDATGGFDPRFPMYCEDVDLSFRVREAGYGLHVAPQARFFHDITGRMGENNPARSVRMLTGTWYLCAKWGNSKREKALYHRLLSMGVEAKAFPARPEVSSHSEQIARLMKQDRFAESRFWA